MLKTSLGALGIMLLTSSFAFAGSADHARASQRPNRAVQSAQVQRTQVVRTHWAKKHHHQTNRQVTRTNRRTQPRR